MYYPLKIDKCSPINSLTLIFSKPEDKLKKERKIHVCWKVMELKKFDYCLNQKFVILFWQ